jgi:hypothetical protein
MQTPQFIDNNVKMKKFLWFMLFYGYVAQSFGDKKLVVSSALTKVIREFYVVRSEHFDIMIYGRDKRFLNELVNDIAKGQSEKFPFKIVNVRESEDTIEINQSAILMFDTLDSYQEFHQKAILTNEYPKEFNFLVYIVEIDETEAELLIPSNPFGIFEFEVFLMPKYESSMKLITFETFQQPNCGAWKAVEFNRFSNGTREWRNREFFPNKFNTFNGCELIAIVQYPPDTDGHLITGIDIDDTRGEVAKISGYGITFNNLIGEELNYTTRYNPQNEIAEKFDDQLPSNQFHMLVSPIRLRKNDESHSQPFTTIDSFILISKSEPYTQMEKVFLPFEFTRWRRLIVTSAVAVITILIVKFVLRKMQKNCESNVQPLKTR